MATFKATNKKKDNGVGVFKATDKKSYDASYVTRWEEEAKDSSKLLDEYITRRNKQEWIGEDELENYRSALERYKSSASSLANLGQYSEDDYKKQSEWLSNLSTDFDSASEIYGRYKSADSFNAYLQAVKEDEELAGVDLDALWGDITDLEKRIGEERGKADVKHGWLFSDSQKAKLSDATNGTDIEGLKSTITSMKAKYNRAKEIQDRNRVLGMLEGVTDPASANFDKDFDAYVQKGASIENPSYWDSAAPLDLFGWKPFGDGEEVNNTVTFTLDNQSKFFEGAGTNVRYDTSNMDEVVLDMTEEQINTYNYTLAKHGKETADIYLEAVRSQIKGDKADEFFEKHLEDKWLAEIMYSAVQGFDQFSSGMEAVAGGDSSKHKLLDPQIVGARAREDLADDSIPVWYNFKTGEWEDKIFGSSVAQTAYDLGTTTANMAPSLAIGGLSNLLVPGSGAYVTTGLMGASAGGNAYKEALNRGYDEGQAKTYGVLVGGSEALLQYALGGISKAGGKLSNNVIKKVVDGIDNGFARFALELGGSMMSEGLEEGLQEILAPFFENIAFNADKDLSDVNWEQVAYSYLLGSLSALGMEGPGIVTNNIRHNSALKAEGKSIMNNGGVDSLVALANEMAGVGGETGDVLSKRVGQVNGKKGVNVKAVGRLSESVNNVRVQQNKADIVKALESKGVDSKKAAKYAAVLTSMNEEYFAGEKSTFELGTNSQWKKITGDANAYSVLRDVVTNMESSVNSRNSKYGYARNGVKVAEDGTISLTEERSKKIEQQVLKADYAKQSEEISSAVAKDGKAKVISTDTEVTVNGIDHIETKKVDGKTENVAYLKVTDANGNESVVDWGNVEFGSRTDAVLYEAFVGADIDPVYFDAFVKNFNEADFDTTLGEAAIQYANGFRNAFRYGWANMETEMNEDVYASKLTDTVRNTAYTLGKDNVTKDVEAEQKALDTAVAERKASGKGKVRTQGKLHMEGVKTKKRTAMQNAGIGLANRLTSLGLDVYVYESSMNAKGEWVDDRGKVTDNGFYRANDGSVHIDLNAGSGSESLMAYTLSHELVHHMREYSPKKFKDFADILFKWYGEKGHTINDVVSRKMDELDCDWDTAYEEVVADSCESFLTDSDIADRILELQETDKGLWETIRDKVLEFLDWMKSLFTDADPDSVEGKFVRQYKNEIDHLYDAFYNTLADATETFQWIGARDISTFAEAKTTDGDTLFQHRAMEADKAIYRDMLLKHGQMSSAEINSLFKTVDKALAIIKSNLEALDYAWDADIDDRAFSPVKPNSDSLYKVSLDFSTLCRKRILQQLVQARLQEALNKQLSREESIAIRDELMKIQEEGRQIEIACALCYVESARMKSPAQIKKFMANRESVITEFLASKSGGNIKQKIKQAEAEARERLGVGDASLKSLQKNVADQIRDAKRQAKKSYLPTAEEQRLIDVAMSMSVSDFTSPSGLENLAKNYPVLFDAYTSYVRNATKSKGIENDTWWRAGDSASIGDTLIANMNKENGLRSQSWSDFQVIHLLDYIAATIELSTRNAKEQAYSKVPDYIELMGNTGVMLNMSLIPTRVFNGKLEYDSVEGMDYKRSLALRDKYHATAGTICIGVNNGQIKLLLADGTIDYVIPYHKSGMAAHIRQLMHIPKWDNYEDYQSEKNLSRKDAEANAKKYGVKLLDENDPNYHKHTSFSEWFDLKEAQQIAKMENANPSNKSAQKKYGVMYGGYMAMQNAANNYLKLCAERGVAPVFSHEKADFTSEENYWKLLIDRKMVDNVTGEIIEQQTIKPIFDEGEVLRILNDELERYPKVKADQEYAIRTVTERFLSGEMNDRLDADTIATIMQKPVDNVAVTNIAESAKQDDGIKKSSRKSLAKKGKSHYNEFASIAMQWANSNTTKAGDTKTIYDGRRKLYVVIVATDDGFIEAKTYTRKEYEQYYERLKQSGVKFSTGRIEVRDDNGGDGTYDVRLGDRKGNVSYDRVHGEEGVSDRYESDKQGDWQAHPDGEVKKSSRKKAHTFYSYMGVVVDGVKQEKLGAASVINMLKGKGVKDEEIKWSGIETWLEGKKSVTKAELQEFIAGSQLQIADEVRSFDENVYSEIDVLWKEHFGESLEDRFDVKGSYFNGDSIKEYVDEYVAYSKESGADVPSSDAVEKIKSLADRMGHQTFWGQYKLDGGSNYREVLFRMPDASHSNSSMRIHWGDNAQGILAHARIQDFVDSNGNKMLFVEEIQSDWHNEGNKKGYEGEERRFKDPQVALTKKGRWGKPSLWSLFDGETFLGETFAKTEGEARKLLMENNRIGTVPDAPFRGNYQEYVLKSLLRTAAEEGYDSLGWTTAQIQSDRWSDEYAEGYRIEYDQDIPKFLRKYGKKWGASVSSATVNGGTEVWSMPITDSMKDSVLYEGQVMYQRRGTGMSNRSLLANALESATQHESEARRLAEYKAKIDLINAEEQKLQETRARIAELSFAPGARDTVTINNLQATATRIANRISTYDKQLLSLEATAPLKALLDRERAVARKREKQKAAEAMSAYREKSAKALREVMNRNAEARKRGIESRNRTAMRHKIKNVVSELNQLLLHGTRDKHIKIDLQKATAEALSAINMDTVNAEKRLEEIQRKIDATNDPDKIAQLQETYDRIELQGENMMNKLTTLKNAYEEIKDSNDPLVAGAYHPEIEERIKNLRKDVGDTPLREMSLEQLENVYDTYTMVLHTIRSANKKFKADKGESIETLANKTMAEVYTVGGTKAKGLVLAKLFKKFFWNGLKPVFAFKAIGSSTLSDMFDSIREGEDTWAVDVSEAKKYYQDVSKKYNYDSWDLDKRYQFASKTGRGFSLSIEQIMSLYAFSKRKQADEHLDKGGFVFDEAIEVKEKTKLGVPLKYEVNVANAYNLSRETLGMIVSTLTDEQKAFVDEMQAYLSDVMGAKGNEVSLEMFGVKLFKEKFYFPLKSAKQYMYEQNEVAGEVRLKNSGFSKETKAHANNPIILSNFMDVWANHVNDMSMYHAFVLPLEDFNRVFNYKTPTTDKTDTESVKMYIQNAYGSQPIQYIKQLLTDLNGGARTDPTTDFITKMIGLFKKSAVFASASVVIQQPTSIARATALIDSKYFVTKLSIAQHKEEWAEVKRYAPVAIIKEMGYFDTHIGRSTTDFIKAKEYDGVAEKMKGLVTDSGYRDEVLSKAPAVADELGWCYIWNAVKKEIADTTDIEVGSEEFLKRCGERFTEVVVNTQVYDSVLSRSAMMRSKDTGMKMATAFMAEPTTSINMIVDAIIQGKRGNKTGAKKQIGAVIAASILNSILVSFVYAGRDDDEDKTYAEKYVGTLTSELIDGFNPLTMIPFVKDIVSIAQGYDVERSDMAIISDLFTAFKKLSNDNLSTYRKVEDFGGAVASIFGLPVKNIMRDVRGMYNTVFSFINGQKTTGMGIGQAVKEAITGKADSNTEQLYDAIVSGDEAHEERVKGKYKNESTYETAMKKALRENDPRIREALKIRVNEGITNKYQSIRQEIIDEGNFEQSIVNEALKAEYDYFMGKVEEAADLLKDGDKESSDDIIRSLKKKYKGTFTQDDILKAVKKRAGLLK